MSTHRELKAAQLALNEAVRLWAHLFGMRPHRPDDVLTKDEEQRRAEAILERYDALVALQSFDGDRPAVARDTSIAAAKTRPPAAGSLRRRIVQAITTHWKLYDTGLTADDLCVRLRRGHASVSSAVSDMETKGWIEDSGQRRETSSKCKAIVWRPTERAMQMIQEGG